MTSFILNPEQERVVEAALKFLKSSNQLFEYDGCAGVGKSVVLHEIIRRSHLKYSQIAPMAYTGSAACVMRTKGFPNARSIHSWLYELVKMQKVVYDDQNKKSFTKYDTQFNKPQYEYRFVPRQPGTLDPEIKLFIIDEAWMVPDIMKKDIMKHGIKVIATGDSGQLPPVVGEPAFLTGENVMHLTQIMRQAENNPIIYLANRAREGLPIHCGLYGNRALVIPDTDLTTDMVLDVGNIICGTNKTRDYFNTKVRQLLNLNPEIPQFGERVICRNNNWQVTRDNIALANGLAGVICSPISIDSFSNKNLRLDFLPDLLNTPFESLIVNYDYMMSDYETRQKIKDSKFEIHNGELFEFAYAITTHLSQGSEYPCGIFYEEFLRSNIQRQLCYTGITRFKEYIIYVKKTIKKYY